MAITINQLYDKCTASENEKGQGTYSLVFRVLSDEGRIGPGLAKALVRTELSITMFSTYVGDDEYDTGAFYKGMDVSSEASDAKQWLVTVNYGPPNESQQNETDNPLAAPLEISGGYSQFQKPVDQSIDGEAIVNPAGDPYLDQDQKDDSRQVLSITRNEASSPAALAFYYRDSVNTDAFAGAGPGEVKVSNVSWQVVNDSNFGQYYRTTYEFAHNPDGWKLKKVACGMREKGDDGKLKPILVKGVAISEPQLLDKKGKVVPPNGEPYVQEWKIYNETAFSGFGLG